MPAPEHFAANLAMMFTDAPLLERFARARAAGFRAVEISSPEMFQHGSAALGAALRGAELRCCLFNMPLGERDGDMGLAAQPGRESEFEASIGVTIEYCRALGCRAVHCLAGNEHDDKADNVQQQRQTYVANLRRLADRFEPEGIIGNLEPLNAKMAPQYFLKSNEMAASILAEVDRPDSVKLQFDFFHTQIINGDVTTQVRAYLPLAGHVQIAGVPERHEPDDTQELNYDFILAELDRLQWDGFVGCEYRPRDAGVGGTERGLGWLARHGLRPRPGSDDGGSSL